MARPPAYGASGFGFEPHGIKKPHIILLEMVTSWRPLKKRPWVLIPGGILDCLTFNTPIVFIHPLKITLLAFSVTCNGCPDQDKYPCYLSPGGRPTRHFYPSHHWLFLFLHPLNPKHALLTSTVFIQKCSMEISNTYPLVLWRIIANDDVARTSFSPGRREPRTARRRART